MLPVQFQMVWRSPDLLSWTSQKPPARILVVDDDPSLLSLLRILLISSGYEVTTAENGQVALEKAADLGFDLILLDLEMPVMNGRQFFAELRSRGYDTPVIVVSAFGAEMGKRELGAAAAIAKPFEPGEVSRMVEELLNS